MQGKNCEYAQTTPVPCDSCNIVATENSFSDIKICPNPNPCKNGGGCTVSNESISGFICFCHSGYSGKFIFQQLNPILNIKFFN